MSQQVKICSSCAARAGINQWFGSPKIHDNYIYRADSRYSIVADTKCDCCEQQVKEYWPGQRYYVGK